MGKIGNMQDKYNYFSDKSRLNTKGIRKIKLLKPGIEKEYSLTRRQKHYARIIRGTTVGIATLAATVSIGAAAVNYVSDKNTSRTETTYETNNEILDRQLVFAKAKETLAYIILPNGSISNNIPGYVEFPNRDEYGNIISVRVSEMVGLDFYSRYDYNITFNEDRKNTSQVVNRFMDALIKVANEENASQKDLQELKELTEKISELNLSLKSGHIVDLNSKEIEDERE